MGKAFGGWRPGSWLCVAACGLAMATPLGTPWAQAQSAPTVTTTFHTIGLYWTRPKVAAGVAIQYRHRNSSVWKTAQSLWWDSLSGISTYRNQYRGSIVNLRPGARYVVRYSLNGGGSWTTLPTITTRSQTFAGTITRYSGLLSGKLVVNTGGTPGNWRIYDGQGTTTIDTGHADDCVLLKASYVVIRNFEIRDCRYNGVVVEKPNVVIEGNTIYDWGIREIDPANPTPRRGNVSQRPLSDPLSTCIAGTDKGDFGRLDDSGIYVRASGNDGIVIQRNVIRNPRYRSTRWVECPGYDNHPYGPSAIYISSGASESAFGKGNVIRYNNIYATITTSGAVTLHDDANRYYDIILAHYQQDFDVYGNIIRNGTDDAIEVDNAAVNTRIWGNYVDYALTMISHQHMEAGPSYVFRNIFDRGADNYAGNPGALNVGIYASPYTSGSPLKYKQDNGSIAAFNGPAYVYHNTSLRTGLDGFKYGYSIFAENAGKEPNDYKNLISRNNVFMSGVYYLYDTHPRNWVGYVFSDAYNHGNNTNNPYTTTNGLMTRRFGRQVTGRRRPGRLRRLCRRVGITHLRQYLYYLPPEWVDL